MSIDSPQSNHDLTVSPTQKAAAAVNGCYFLIVRGTPAEGQPASQLNKTREVAHPL